MPFQRISVSDQIFDDLVDKIRKREIKPGEKLVIRSLEQMYGVSSSPVRDALYRLLGAGFIDMSSSSTARVIEMSDEDRQHLVRINLMLVRMSYALIKENDMLSSLLEKMEPLYIRQIELKNASSYERIRAFIDFVNYPGMHTGNKYYASMTSTLFGKSVVAFGDYTEVYDPDEALENSRQMIEALKNKDYDRFQELRFYMIEAFGRYLSKKCIKKSAESDAE